MSLRSLQPALLLALAVVAAACGGAAAPTTTTTTSATTTTPTTLPPEPTTTTTTLPAETTTTTEDDGFAIETIPDDPVYSLMLDGLEQFGSLGDPAQPIIGAMLESFGDPAADSDWIDEHGCSFEGPMRTITWVGPGVRVVFVDGDSDLGGGEHLASYTTLQLGFGVPETPWQMFGIRRGTNLAELGELFPDVEVFPGPGLDYIQFDPTTLSFAWIDGSGAILDFWGGIEFCDD